MHHTIIDERARPGGVLARSATAVVVITLFGGAMISCTGDSTTLPTPPGSASSVPGSAAPSSDAVGGSSDASSPGSSTGPSAGEATVSEPSVTEPATTAVEATTTAIATTALPTTAIPTTAIPTTAIPTTAIPTTAIPTTEPAPTTTTIVTQGALVLVANATNVQGAAGKLADLLSAVGFQLAGATNAAGNEEFRDTSQIYCLPGSEAVAGSISLLLSGIPVNYMPTPAPITDATVGLGDASVLVMLGKDYAGKIPPELRNR